MLKSNDNNFCIVFSTDEMMHAILLFSGFSGRTLLWIRDELTHPWSFNPGVVALQRSGRYVRSMGSMGSRWSRSISLVRVFLPNFGIRTGFAARCKVFRGIRSTLEGYQWRVWRYTQRFLKVQMDSLGVLPAAPTVYPVGSSRLFTESPQVFSWVTTACSGVICNKIPGQVFRERERERDIRFQVWLTGFRVARGSFSSSSRFGSLGGELGVRRRQQGSIKVFAVALESFRMWKCLRKSKRRGCKTFAEFPPG